MKKIYIHGFGEQDSNQSQFSEANFIQIQGGRSVMYPQDTLATSNEEDG